MSAHTHEQLAERKGPKGGPMRMKTRQQKYGQKLRGRIQAIRAEMRRGVVERDIFHLRESTTPTIQAEQLADDFDPRDLNPADYTPGEDVRNQDRFMQWLREQQRRGIVNLVSQDGNLYVKNAARDGVRWADARLREEGVDVTTETLDAVFNAPVDARTLSMLYRRNYSLLEGVTSDMENEIGEALTRGFIQGLGPNEIASNMADIFNGTGLNRATLIARHEVMFAANTAAKTRLKQYDVSMVDILGSSPCDQCKPYVNGGPYPIDDMPEGGPPFHPQCVGTVVPAAF